MISRSLKNLLLWNRLAKWTKTWWKASMECHLYRLPVLSWSVNKHGRHMQLLFPVGRFLKNSSLMRFSKWTETWLEASMEGPLCRSLILSRSLPNMAASGNFCFRLVDLLKNLFLWNRVAKWTKFGRKHIWKVLYNVSSKQIEMRATQAQSTEPLVLFGHCIVCPTAIYGF
jgi:hypothetical protein